MLSKNNKILIGCLALLLVMSIGYALFSDTITINGSATAKGDFELTTTCSIAPQEDITGSEGAFGGYDLSYLGASKNEISCNNNVVDISTSLDFPGAYAWYKIVVTNDGTIPATLKSIDVNYNNQSTVINEENAYTHYFYVDKLYVELYSSAVGDEVNEFYYEPIHSPGSGLFETDFTDKLPPGKSFVYYIKAFWHESDETQRPEGLTLDYTLDFNYEQATE